MTTAKKLMTASELMALPDDGNRYELIRGELITMAPASAPHGGVTDRIGRRIGNFVEAHNLGRTYAAETGVFIEHDPDTVRAPDYAFISRERIAGASVSSGYSEIIPDLVVEVVAGDYRSSVVDAKTRMWLDAGVRLVLVAYVGSEEIAAHYDDATVERFGIDDTFTCGAVLPGFSCPVSDIFA